MRKLSSFMILLLAVALSGCEAIGDIFSAGVYTGIFVVVVVVIIIVWIFAKLGKR